MLSTPVNQKLHAHAIVVPGGLFNRKSLSPLQRGGKPMTRMLLLSTKSVTQSKLFLQEINT